MRIDTILRFVTVDVPGTSRHPASPALSGISSMSAMRHALPSPPITDPNQTSPHFLPQGKNISPALPPSPLSPGMSPHHRPQQGGVRTAEAMLELERTLDTAQVLDLFTMQPKVGGKSMCVSKGVLFALLLAHSKVVAGNARSSVLCCCRHHCNVAQTYKQKTRDKDVH